MSSFKSCLHINQISDIHEGSYVCTDCGLVLDQIYLCDFEKEKEQTEKNVPCMYQEMLERLNISLIRNNDYTSNNVINVACKIYQNINNESAITLKEVTSATGVSSKMLNNATKGSVTIVDKEILLEKYCCQLDIAYKHYTLIKELLQKQNISGHNPLTIIGSCIYLYSKEKKLKISMKKISDCTGISCISIQRFIKKIIK